MSNGENGNSVIDEIFDVIERNEDDFYRLGRSFNPEEVEDFARQYVDEEGLGVDPSEEEIKDSFRDYRIGRGDYPPSDENIKRQEESFTMPRPVRPGREETSINDDNTSKEYIGLLVGIHEDGEEFEGGDIAEVDRSVIAYGEEFEEYVGGGFVAAEILKEDEENSRRTSLSDLEDSLTPEEGRMARGANHVYGVKTDKGDIDITSPSVEKVVDQFLKDYGGKNSLGHLMGSDGDSLIE